MPGTEGGPTKEELVVKRGPGVVTVDEADEGPPEETLSDERVPVEEG